MEILEALVSLVGRHSFGYVMTLVVSRSLVDLRITGFVVLSVDLRSP